MAWIERNKRKEWGAVPQWMFSGQCKNEISDGLKTDSARKHVKWRILEWGGEGGQSLPTENWKPLHRLWENPAFRQWNMYNTTLYGGAWQICNDIKEGVEWVQ